MVILIITLQVDEDKREKNSDHLQAVFAPSSDMKFKIEQKKYKITTQPLPESKIPAFGQEIQHQSWIQV